MALSTNREILYGNPVEKIEHLTGKTLLSWRRDPQRFGITVFFTDKTMCHIDEAAPFDWSKVEYLRIPTSICVSCGQDAHASEWDWKQQCSATVKRFWKQMRKVFWHRYQKNRKLMTKCTNKNCAYEWEPKKKQPKACPKCRQYLKL